MSTTLFDVAIVGLGPAGSALARRCAVHGLRVAAVDHRYRRPWRATLGAWEDELPGWLPDDVTAARVHAPAVHTGTVRRPDRTYAIFDGTRLREAVDPEGSTVFARRAVRVTTSAVLLEGGERIEARRVVDARGLPRSAGRREQTAYGIVVESACAAPVLEGQSAWFMDWRRDNGAAAGSRPSFLYAVPLGDGRVLVEETCLVGAPPLALGELRERLYARLRARGVRPTGREPVERVRFALHAGRARPAGAVEAFGSRAGLMHPASGFSVAESLRTADRAAAALASGGTVRDALWGPRARTVHRLRLLGSAALDVLPPDAPAGFFDAFFRLPADRQCAYLSARDRPTAVFGAMADLFARADPAARRTVVRTALSGGAVRW